MKTGTPNPPHQKEAIMLDRKTLIIIAAAVSPKKWTVKIHEYLPVS